MHKAKYKRRYFNINLTTVRDPIVVIPYLFIGGATSVISWSHLSEPNFSAVIDNLEAEIDTQLLEGQKFISPVDTQESLLR